MARDVLILNGPNLNLLGRREPGVYGTGTLADLEALCAKRARAVGFDGFAFRQSNHEGVLVDWIQEAGLQGAGVVLNAGAYTHTSIALHDAIKGSGARVVEVHLSNVHAREPFRNHSYISPVAAGVILGLGPLGYLLAIDALAEVLAP